MPDSAPAAASAETRRATRGFAASHWLSRALLPLSPGTAWFADLEGEARAEFAALARADWTQFLRCPADQMVADGLLEGSALNRFVFPLWFPTAEEACAPINGELDLKHTFEILEASVPPAPVHPNDVHEDSLSDPETYARLYAG